MKCLWLSDHINSQYSYWGQYNELLKSHCFSRDSFIKLNQRLFHLCGIWPSFWSTEWSQNSDAVLIIIICETLMLHGRPTEQFHMFWLVPVCPDVFSWEPQCWKALTSAGHCWVLVQCRKQVLNSQQQTSPRKKRLQAEAQECGKLETWAQKVFFPLLNKWFRIKQE